MKNIVLGSVLAIAFIFAMYGAYWINRTVGYNMKYKSQVEQTIKAMVKPEALR